MLGEGGGRRRRGNTRAREGGGEMGDILKVIVEYSEGRRRDGDQKGGGRLKVIVEYSEGVVEMETRKGVAD